MLVVLAIAVVGLNNIYLNSSTVIQFANLNTRQFEDQNGSLWLDRLLKDLMSAALSISCIL